METSEKTPSPANTLDALGFVVLLIGCGGGTWLGTHYRIGAGLLDDGTFNWWLFLMCAGPGVVCAAVLIAAAAVVRAIQRA